MPTDPSDDSRPEGGAKSDERLMADEFGHDDDLDDAERDEDEFDEADVDDRQLNYPPGKSPARRATLFAVPAALIAGVLAFFVVRANLPEPESTDATAAAGPLGSVSISAADSAAAPCANLVAGLPADLDDRPQRPVTGRPGFLAWGDPPIVLACGVGEPTGIEPTQNLNVVNSVTWYVQENVDTTAYGLPGSHTLWTALDREVYVAVAVPAEVSGATVISPVSTIIAERLTSRE